VVVNRMFSAMSDKQLAIPGLPIPKIKEKKPTQDERINELASRVLRLELEVALLGLQLEGDNDHG